MIRQDRLDRYEVLQHLQDEKSEPGEAPQLAERLGLTEKATRLTIDRYRRILEQELRRAVEEETHE